MLAWQHLLCSFFVRNLHFPPLYLKIFLFSYKFLSLNKLDFLGQLFCAGLLLESIGYQDDLTAYYSLLDKRPPESVTCVFDFICSIACFTSLYQMKPGGLLPSFLRQLLYPFLQTKDIALYFSMCFSPLECIFLLRLSKICHYWALLTALIYFKLHVFCLNLAAVSIAFIYCGVWILSAAQFQ